MLEMSSKIIIMFAYACTVCAPGSQGRRLPSSVHNDADWKVTLPEPAEICVKCDHARVLLAAM